MVGPREKNRVSSHWHRLALLIALVTTACQPSGRDDETSPKSSRDMPENLSSDTRVSGEKKSACQSGWRAGYYAVFNSRELVLLAHIPTFEMRDGIAKVWIMLNNCSFDANLPASANILYRFDCNERTMIILEEIYFDQPNLTGRLLRNTNVGDQTANVAPGSVNEALMKSACTK